MNEELESGPDAANEETEKRAGSPGNRLSDADFAEAKELYELGKAGLGELAETYGISRQGLSKRFKDNGVIKGSRAHEVAAATKGAATAAAAAAERFADKRADWIEETRIEGVTALRQARLIARKVMADNLKKVPAVPMAAIDDDLKAVQRYNKILIENIQAALDILRANDHVDEEDLPALTIEDLTNEEILQHHKNSGVLPEDATVEDMLAEEIDLGELE